MSSKGIHSHDNGVTCVRAVLFKISWLFSNPSANCNDINHGCIGESLLLTQLQLNTKNVHDGTRLTPIHDTRLTPIRGGDKRHQLIAPPPLPSLILNHVPTKQRNGPGLPSVQYNYNDSDKKIAPPNTNTFPAMSSGKNHM